MGRPSQTRELEAEVDRLQSKEIIEYDSFYVSTSFFKLSVPENVVYNLLVPCIQLLLVLCD